MNSNTAGHPIYDSSGAYVVYKCINHQYAGKPMARQGISFTAPNEAWLKAQVESAEYTSKSEVVNDLIRIAREHEYVRNKLISAEQGGFSNLTPEEILAKAKAALDSDAKL